jgi:hypothetical protein
MKRKRNITDQHLWSFTYLPPKIQSTSILKLTENQRQAGNNDQGLQQKGSVIFNGENIVMCRGYSMTNNNGFWIWWLDLLALLLQLQSIINSSQSMTVSDSLHSLLDYEHLPFCATDLVLIYESLRMIDEWRHTCDWIIELDYQWQLTNALSFITQGKPKRHHHLEHFIWNYLFLRNVCQSCGNALISTRVFVATKCSFSQPFSSNGLFRHNMK